MEAAEHADLERCDSMLLTELAQAVEESEINEVVFQALICAYLGHPGWQRVAEAVFEKHGYTPDEIRLHNDGPGGAE